MRDDYTDPLDLFYSTAGDLTIEDWEQIVHCLISYGKAIWLHADASMSNSVPATIRDRIAETVDDLLVEGSIKTWSLAASTIIQEPRRRSLRVIGEPEQVELYSAMNTSVVRDPDRRRSPFGDDFSIPSKFVEVRHELWNLGVARLCGADGVAYRRAPQRSQIVSNYYRYEQINKQYTTQLFQRFRIGALSHLTTRDIIELRLLSAPLRQQIDTFLAERILPLSTPEEDATRACEQMFNEYHGTLIEIMRERTGIVEVAKASRDTAVTAVGLYFPIVGLLPIGGNLGDWFRNRSKRGFVLYMMELERRATAEPVRLDGTKGRSR